MDIVIVSTSNRSQEDFWQQRLSEMRGVISKPDTIMIAVTEDWQNGAGNGLGTLYAYRKAQEKAKYLYQTDLFEKQKEGASVAIYHTAGKGMRLYPLTASEYNNKSAVKLPALFGSRSYLTILESVILQTSKLGDSRKGRLSVFWGDQVFLTSREFQYHSGYHIDILSTRRSWPNENTWREQNLDKYGLIIQDYQNKTRLCEKISYPSLKKILLSLKNPKQSTLSVSLGSFSLSASMTFALLREYEKELMEKRVRLDSDFHFWMPLTLEKKIYTELTKGRAEAEEQYSRMDRFKQKFCELHDSSSLFGTFDIGKGAIWWDYGSLKHYFANIRKLTSHCIEGKAMRLFFRIERDKCHTSQCRVIKDEASCLINCRINSGRIVNSILVGVDAESIDVKDSVIIHSKFTKLQADRCLLYHVNETNPMILDPDTVRADAAIHQTGEYYKFTSKHNRDSKEDWHMTLPSNPISYEQFYEKFAN